MKDNIIASLDVGTSKIVCLIGSFNTNNKICVKGIGHQESKGINNGNVEDVKLLTKSIINVISMAEKMAGFNIEDIVVNISGDNVKSVFTTVGINPNDKVVSRSDVFRLARKVEENFLSTKREILHLIPVNYYIDNIQVKNPFDIIGNELKVDFNTIFTDKSKIDNLKFCLKKTPIVITKFIASSYATALACLTRQEKDNGVLLIDIGAGLTSFAVIQNNTLIYNRSIPLAGNIITVDIADILKAKIEVAEQIKISNVDLLLDKNEENSIININIDSDEDYRIAKNTKKIINDIYRERIKEIVKIIFEILDKKKIRNKIKSIVLTGGTVKANAVDYYINKITNLDTRKALVEFDLVRNGIEIKKYKEQSYSCAFGLLMKAQERLINKDSNNDYKEINKSKISEFFDYLVKLFIC